MKFLRAEAVTYYAIEYPNGLFHVRTSPWTVRQEKTSKREQATITTERSVMVDHLYHIHQHEKPPIKASPRLIQWRVLPMGKENDLKSGIGKQHGQVMYAYAIGKLISIKGMKDTFYYLSPGQLWDQGKHVWKPLMYAYWLSENEANRWLSCFSQIRQERKKRVFYEVIPIRIEKEVLYVN